MKNPIVVEDTAAENPVKKIAQKHGLDQSSLSLRWDSTSSELVCRACWYGRQFARVSAANPSWTCPSRGHVAAESRPDQSTFR